jgi:hypothetical protein
MFMPLCGNLFPANSKADFAGSQKYEALKMKLDKIIR